MMERIRLLHTGDLHLGSPLHHLGEKSAQRQQELENTLFAIVRLAKQEQVDAVLIAGDLFDSSAPDAQLLQRCITAFRSIPDIPVLLVRGNHDYALRAVFPPNVHVFESYLEKYSIKNCDIYGVSFETEHCTSCIIEGLRPDDPARINVLLVHGDVAAASAYNPVPERVLAQSGMDYAALGHIHRFGGFQRAGQTTYAYCGIPEPRAFDEAGEKGVILAEVQKGSVNGRFVPLSRRRLTQIELDVSKAADNGDILDLMLAAAQREEDFYRFILQGVTTLYVDTGFLKTAAERTLYDVTAEDRTAPSVPGGGALLELFSQKCGGHEEARLYGSMALRGEKVPIE